MRIERHIFGSRDGYCTLAHSAGLSAAECKALQGFAFGTPYDPALRASLAKHPAYWSRPVGRHKRAITRVMLGEADDAGRPTLLFLSAVISADDWDQVLQGDAGPLLKMANLWRWNPSTQLEALLSTSPQPSALRLSGQGIQRVLSLVSLLEQAWTFRRPVVVPEGSCSFEEILAVERLLPPQIRRTYSVVYRGISSAMPVSLNSLSRSVPADSANPFRSLAGAVSPYAKLLAQGGLLEGRIPCSFIQRYQHFSQTFVETFDGSTERDSMTKLPGSPTGRLRQGASARLVAIVGLALVFGTLLGSMFGWFAHRRSPNPWQRIARMAIAVPLVPSNEQVQAMVSLEEEIGEPSAEDPELRDLKEQIVSQREAAERAYRHHSETKRKLDDAEKKLATEKSQREKEARRANAAEAKLSEAKREIDKQQHVIEQSETAFKKHGDDLQNQADALLKQQTPLSEQDRDNVISIIASIKTLHRTKTGNRFLHEPFIALQELLKANSKELRREWGSLNDPIKKATLLVRENKRTQDHRRVLVSELKRIGNESKGFPQYRDIGEIFLSLKPWIVNPWRDDKQKQADEENKKVLETLQEFLAADEYLSNVRDRPDKQGKRKAIKEARKELNAAFDDLKDLKEIVDNLNKS